MLSESFDKRAGRLEIAIPPGPRLGDLVVDADGVSKAYGDRVLIESLSFKLQRGGIVGVIGPNGAGKTTLFRMIGSRATTETTRLILRSVSAPRPSAPTACVSRSSRAAEPPG